MSFPSNKDRSDIHPFQIGKFLSWSSLIVILGVSLFLVFVIGNYAKQNFIKKEKDYSLLLAENLNHQIYHRFVLPVVLSDQKVELRDKTQYERLDQVIHSTIHGFKIVQVRIFDLKGRVSYSTDRSILGRSDLTDKSFQDALKGKISFEIIEKGSSKWSFFDFTLPKQKYILRLTFPLRAEGLIIPENKRFIIGILQFERDITSDFQNIIYFQDLVATIIFVSFFILFGLLYLIIIKADKLLAKRIKEKERLEKELALSERLASMGRMVSTIAHELKNPLGIIQGSIEILKKKIKDEPLSKLVQAIYEEVRRLTIIVNDFLEFARPIRPSFDKVDLLDLVEEAINFLDSEFKKRKIEVISDVPKGTFVLADKNLLYRAFYNILINACQAIEKEGKIEVKWDDEEKKICFVDSGPGFDMTMLEKYLEPFFTTKNRGTGLGLAIVKNIVSAHNAILTLGRVSEKGGGIVCISFKSSNP